MLPRGSNFRFQLVGGVRRGISSDVAEQRRRERGVVMKRDLYEAVSARIVAELEAGAVAGRLSISFAPLP